MSAFQALFLHDSLVPSKALVDRMAEIDAVNPFCTPQFLEARTQQGDQPCLFHLNNQNEMAAGCFGFLRGKFLRRSLQIVSLPRLPDADSFWHGLWEFCLQSRIWHLQVDSYASPEAQIPILPGETARRERFEYILDLSSEDFQKRVSTNHGRNISRAVSAGFTLAQRPEDASVLVLNTCTVRDNAERRAYGRIAHWKAVKDADPSVKVIVTGCLAEQDKDRMRKLVPHVDGVFGTRELGALGDALAVWRGEYPDDDLTVDREIETVMGGAGEGIAGPYDPLRAFVNVQRGCSYYCTFCIVPHVRGRFDHRPMGDVLAEITAKAQAGAREITLVGQTVNAYKEPATGADFADLIEAVCAIPAVERVNFISSHPKDLNEKLARVCATLPKMNPRFHLALQSGSNPMLRRMNRKYTIEEFLERVGTFKRYNPSWAITTDLIVGFPGETEDDFQRTLDVCATGIFAQAYMFVYSPRRGTPAAVWHAANAVPHEVAQARFLRLKEVQDAAVRAYHDRKLGTTVRALIHGVSRKDPAKLSGKTIDNVTVNFPADEAVPDLAQPWADVIVEGASVWGVRGTCVGRAAAFDGSARPVTAPLIDLLAG